MAKIVEWRGATAARYKEIDGLRGIAALIVVLYHLVGSDHIVPGYLATANFEHWWIFIWSTIFNGTGATTLFFVISGFVLGQGNPAVPSLRFLLSFAVRRILRIMPGVWASLALGAALAVWFWHQPFNFDWWDWLAASLLQTQAGTVNGPLWSLRVEMLGSAIFPILYYASNRTGALGQIAIFAGLMVFTNKETFSFEALYLISFQLGIMSGTLGRPVMAHLSRRYFAAICAMAACGVALACNLERLQLISLKQHLEIEAIGCFILLSGVLARPPTVLFSRAAQFLGRVSYSLYLFNILLVRVLAAAMVWHLPESFTLEHPAAWVILQCVITVPLCLLAAWVGYECVERPFHGLGQNLGHAIMRHRGIGVPVLLGIAARLQTQTARARDGGQ
jgi:peptidoglycan/LPS O-acetylase OafA/YrhL